METIDQPSTLHSRIDDWRRRGETIAFVPTMGNLHSGHLRLVAEGKRHAQRVVVSIFVNPLQFGAGEDLATYPRTLAQDQDRLQGVGCDLLFVPTPETMYPRGLETQTRVEVPRVSDILCGASRPGHFQGVATVVSRLFHMVQPHLALFGEKDYQQLLVIRRLVDDLAFPIEIVGVPTIREPDGLAMSSRNSYLSAEERARAPALFRALEAAVDSLRAGGRPVVVEQETTQALIAAGLRPDYVSVRRSADLALPRDRDQELVVLAAAYLGGTRLIDNVRLTRYTEGDID